MSITSESQQTEGSDGEERGVDDDQTTGEVGEQEPGLGLGCLIIH